MSKFRVVKWYSVSKEIPKESGDYLVFISGAEKQTILSFDSEEQLWHDEDDNFYKVSYWCDLPDLPGDVQTDISVPAILEEKVKFYFSIDELITFRENLAFILEFCDVPDHSCEQLRNLLVYFENYSYLGRQ